MKISDVKKITGCSKKAIEYYIEKNLLFPTVQENGYRDFSEEDIKRLKKIRILSRLGLSLSEIKEFVNGENGHTLLQAASVSALRLHQEKQKLQLLNDLVAGSDWNLTERELNILEKKDSVLEKLLLLFPGFYGEFLAFHFGPFLQNAVTTEQQEEAYEEIIDWLDTVQFSIPEDLIPYLEEVGRLYSVKRSDIFESVQTAQEKLISDPKTYLRNNESAMEEYQKLKETEAWRSSPACRLQEVLKQFNHSSGYNEIFIPAMIRLSPSYAEYHRKLEQANALYLKMLDEKQNCDSA